MASPSLWPLQQFSKDLGKQERRVTGYAKGLVPHALGNQHTKQGGPVLSSPWPHGPHRAPAGQLARVKCKRTVCSQTSLLLFQELLNDALLGSSGVFRNYMKPDARTCSIEPNVPTLQGWLARSLACWVQVRNLLQKNKNPLPMLLLLEVQNEKTQDGQSGDSIKPVPP